jgi:hypothetical protein
MNRSRLNMNLGWFLMFIEDCNFVYYINLSWEVLHFIFRKFFSFSVSWLIFQPPEGRICKSQANLPCTVSVKNHLRLIIRVISNCTLLLSLFFYISVCKYCRTRLMIKPTFEVNGSKTDHSI